ncbi:hypothetical protein Pmar_PMAR004166, partial [Perkinsus marinus ATCC 50983]
MRSLDGDADDRINALFEKPIIEVDDLRYFHVRDLSRPTSPTAVGPQTESLEEISGVEQGVYNND